jgi:hypothetical protein
MSKTINAIADPNARHSVLPSKIVTCLEKRVMPAVTRHRDFDHREMQRVAVSKVGEKA